LIPGTGAGKNPDVAGEIGAGHEGKLLRATIAPGLLEVEEDAHELGWDVEPLRALLAEVGVALGLTTIRPCNCEVCVSA
jgi:hypothetical protein